jgi:hypothetical protein
MQAPGFAITGEQRKSNMSDQRLSQHG